MDVREDELDYTGINEVTVPADKFEAGMAANGLTTDEAELAAR